MLEPGDRLVLFTDGITEARSESGDEFDDGGCCERWIDAAISTRSRWSMRFSTTSAPLRVAGSRTMRPRWWRPLRRDCRVPVQKRTASPTSGQTMSFRGPETSFNLP